MALLMRPKYGHMAPSQEAVPTGGDRSWGREAHAVKSRPSSEQQGEYVCTYLRVLCFVCIWVVYVHVRLGRVCEAVYAFVWVCVSVV